MAQERKSFGQVKEIVDRIKFLDRTFRLMEKGDGYLLQLQYMEADVDNPDDPTPVLQGSRKWYISPFSTETEIVETAFAMCLRSMQHVVGENFTYAGTRVYSPHFSIAARQEMCHRELFDGRDKE